MTRALGRTELLAPAGDRESLQAALLAGADAVYLGGRRFNARAQATNFDADGLTWARRVTRHLGRRLYVTFNTILFDLEWPEVEAELDFLEALCPDALIVQDLGLLQTLRRRGSQLPCHLSTQAAWDGAGGASVLQDLGVERVILPRETPLQDIVELVEKSPFEIEVFVHGAHCYSVSGRCHWSAHLGPRSGNRGNCAQPCRRSYATAGSAPSAHFSPKDLRLIQQVQHLATLGIAAFKIEGRLKNARTIRRIVAAYRGVLDCVATPSQVEDDLDLAFSRQWCEGFLQGSPKAWRTEGVVGHLGLRVGEVLAPPSAGTGKALVRVDRPIRAGMGLSWNEPEGPRDGRRGEILVWTSGEQGQVEVRFRGRGPTRAGLTLYATASAIEEDPCLGWDPRWEATPVALDFEGREGEPLVCRYESEGRKGNVVSQSPLVRSRGQGLEQLLAERFEGLHAGTIVERIDTRLLEPGLFLPPSGLKALRRALVEEVSRCPAHTVQAQDERRQADTPVSEPAQRSEERQWGGERLGGYSIRVYQQEHVEHLLGALDPPGGWVLPLSCAAWKTVEERASQRNTTIKYWLPWVAGPQALDSLCSVLEGMPPGDFLCFSWEAFELARRMPQHRFSLDWTFNVANERAAAVLRERGLGCAGALEAKAPIPGAISVLRLNPLVSVSRFPILEQSDEPILSDHGDVYHRFSLGSAVGLFLERWQQDAPVQEEGDLPVRIDLFIPPGQIQGLLTRLRQSLSLLDRSKLLP